jgi:hypothetical protein
MVYNYWIGKERAEKVHKIALETITTLEAIGTLTCGVGPT